MPTRLRLSVHRRWLGGKEGGRTLLGGENSPAECTGRGPTVGAQSTAVLQREGSMDVRILGDLGVRGEDGEVPLSGSRRRPLFARLVVAGGQVVAADRL